MVAMVISCSGNGAWERMILRNSGDSDRRVVTVRTRSGVETSNYGNGRRERATSTQALRLTMPRIDCVLFLPTRITMLLVTKMTRIPR